VNSKYSCMFEVLERTNDQNKHQMKNLQLSQKEIKLLTKALRTRMNHESDDDAYIEFMKLKDMLEKVIS